jgi:hypothetical protein
MEIKSIWVATITQITTTFSRGNRCDNHGNRKNISCN